MRCLPPVVLLFACLLASGWASANEMGVAPVRGGRVGTHGMVVFGGPATGIYWSHIPMFHPPHDLQAVFRVHWLHATQDVPTMTGLWTFLPERCSLDDLVLGIRTTVHGTLYDGNFEEGGRPVLEADAVIDRVITATPLVGGSSAPPVLSYRAFGDSKRVYLYHPISQAPGFDQLLSVELGPAQLTERQLQDGITLHFGPAPDQVSRRLEAGKSVVARLDDGRLVLVEVREELSALVGPTFDRPPPPPTAPTPPAPAPPRGAGGELSGAGGRRGRSGALRSTAKEGRRQLSKGRLGP